MADFEPVRMTDPSGKGPDFVASNAIEFNDMRFRDGYVVAKDQRPLGAETEAVAPAAVVSEATVVESEAPKAERAPRPRADK